MDRVNILIWASFISGYMMGYIRSDLGERARVIVGIATWLTLFTICLAKEVTE